MSEDRLRRRVEIAAENLGHETLRDGAKIRGTRGISILFGTRARRS
jgi:hypothetical protein